MAQQAKIASHIFIVGLGRTGSTLTRAILNTHPEIQLGGESHFLRDLPRPGLTSRQGFLAQLKRVGDWRQDANAVRVVDVIFQAHPKHFKFWDLAAKGSSRDEYLERFLQSDRSERALFDLALEVHAQGRAVKGEKTPAHIFFVPQLLSWFPNGRIVHTFRDPRGIFSSSHKKAEKRSKTFVAAAVRQLGLIFQLYSASVLIYNWKRVTRLHRIYARDYRGRYELLRYEDLICAPAERVEALCNFLGIEFHAAMLDQGVVNTSFGEKNQRQAGFDPAALERWREYLHPMLQKWFAFWCRAELAEFGYPRK